MAYWELVDPPPVLRVPAARVEDSVFENQVFVPPDLDDESVKEKEKSDSIPVNLTMEVKEEVPSGPPSSEPSVKPIEPPVESASEDGVKELLKSVKQKKEEPFKEEPIKPEDDMPPELAYELKMMGDGVIGEEGEVKVERKPKKVKE